MLKLWLKVPLIISKYLIRTPFPEQGKFCLVIPFQKICEQKFEASFFVINLEISEFNANQFECSCEIGFFENKVILFNLKARSA